MPRQIQLFSIEHALGLRIHLALAKNKKYELTLEISRGVGSIEFGNQLGLVTQFLFFGNQDF